MKSAYYASTASVLGDVVVVWRQKGNSASVVRIMLSVECGEIDDLVQESFSGAIRKSHGIMDRMCINIRNFLSGQEVTFSDANIDMSVCGAFQRKVLTQVIQIPRGRVSTYSRLAEKIGIPKSARAVGNALARNPFPLVVPCHRVIKADGGLGGFGGGLTMKKTLLGREGVIFDEKEKVPPRFLY